jgi:hypothetical protein
VGSNPLGLLPPEIAAVYAQHGGHSTAVVACRLAVDSAGLEDRRVANALDALTMTGPTRALADSIQQSADEHDEAAWAAQDRGDAVAYALLFRRARAAAALASAHRDAPREAVYEAAHAFDDLDHFAAALRAALS